MIAESSGALKYTVRPNEETRPPGLGTKHAHGLAVTSELEGGFLLHV